MHGRHMELFFAPPVASNSIDQPGHTNTVSLDINDAWHPQVISPIEFAIGPIRVFCAKMLLVAHIHQRELELKTPPLALFTWKSVSILSLG